MRYFFIYLLFPIPNFIKREKEFATREELQLYHLPSFYGFVTC